MLNTIMALWNQNPVENKYKTFKIVLMSLFVSISVSLLLLTFNGSLWSLFAGGEHPIKRDTSRRNTMNVGRDVSVVSTPTRTPTPTPTTTTITATRVQPCPLTPTIVVSQKVFIAPHRDTTSIAKGNLGNNKQKYVHSKSVVSKKGNPHAKKTPGVKATTIPLPQPTRIIAATPVETATAQQSTPAPTATDVPMDGTVVGDVQSTRASPITMSATPTASFKEHIQDKGTMLVSTHQQSRAVGDNLMCRVSIATNK